MNSIKEKLDEINNGCGNIVNNKICGLSYNATSKPTRFIYCSLCRAKKESFKEGALLIINQEIEFLKDEDVTLEAKIAVINKCYFEDLSSEMEENSADLSYVIMKELFKEKIKELTELKEYLEKQ